MLLKSGVIGGLRIVPLYGQQMTVTALDANGNTIGSQSFETLPNNQQTLTNPTAVDALFDVDQSVARFVINVPPTSFVTIIRIYLLDP